jgi:gliding motility-associated-like protein
MMMAKNDYFLITCVSDINNHLAIYNRYGGLVYETNNYANNWNGVDNDGELLPDGGYMWVLELIFPDGHTQLLKGTVNLLRTAD